MNLSIFTNPHPPLHYWGTGGGRSQLPSSFQTFQVSFMIARFPYLAPKNAAGAAGQVNLACFSAMSSAPYGVASDAGVLVTLVPVRFSFVLVLGLRCEM
jgi:hypothetical protein